MAKWGSFVWGDSTKWGHAVADYPHRVPLTIKIAGIDRSNSIDPTTLLIEEVATKQDSRASFVITGGSAMSLAELDAVIIAGWEQQHEFAGYVWKLEELTRGVQLDYRVDCTDYTWDLKHPEALVDEEYSGRGDQYIIQDFMATSCPGIEVDTYVEEVNSDTVHMSFDNETPFAVIERLAEDAGAEWYVDFGPVAGDPTKWAYLHYFDSGTNSAPYSLSDTPDFSASFPYKNVSEFTEAPLANKVIVVGRDLTATRSRGAEADYGRWLVAKLVDLDITTTAQANSVGDQFLIEVATSASYSLDAREPGLRAGQNVTFVNAIRAVDDSFMIMSLTKRFGGAGLATYAVQLGKHIPSLAAIIVSDSDAGGLTGTVVADAIKAELAVFDEALFYVETGDPIAGFNIGGVDLFTLGIDDSDSDKFKISLDDVLGVNDVLEIDSSGNLALRNSGEFRFHDDGNYVGFKAPALAADQMWTLPTADGTSGQYLQTDGAGTLSWATVTGDVVGPGSSTDNAIARWDGTGGDTLQDSDVTIDDNAGIIAQSGGTDTRALVSLESYNDQKSDTCESELRFYKSHSDTVGTLATTVDLEYLGGLRFYGIDTNNAWQEAAHIEARQKGAAGAGAWTVPASMRIYAQNSIEIIGSDGVIELDAGSNIVLGADNDCEINVSVDLDIQAGGTLTVGASGDTLAFFNVAGTTRPSAYSPSNVTPDKTYDADATTTAELADVLGTLIADMQALGLVG